MSTGTTDHSESITNQLLGEDGKGAASGEGAGEGEGAKGAAGGEGDKGADEFKHIEGNLSDYLPKELRDDPSLAPIKDLPALAKSFIHAQKSIGANKVTVPSEHATNDDWKQVFHKLGLPDKVEDYKLKVPEGSVFEDEELQKSLQNAMYDQGILPRQAEELIKWYDQTDKALTEKALDAQKTKLAQGLQELKSQQGKAWPEFVEKVAVAVDHFSETLGVDMNKHLKETGMANDPVTIKLLSAVGNNLKEGSVKSGAQKGEPLYTPEQAQNKINEIMGNSDHEYFKSSHPNHKAAVEQMQKLFEFANPDSKPIDVVNKFVP